MTSRFLVVQVQGVLHPSKQFLMRGKATSVSGEVRYAGMDAQEMAKHYKGEVVYNNEGERMNLPNTLALNCSTFSSLDDIHIATLTVAQTLSFALSTKTPGPNGCLPGISRKEFDAQVQGTLLHMLNISHMKQTLVGDEFARGISGGE